MKAKDFFKNKTGLSIRSARKLKVKYTPTELVRFAEEYHTNSTPQEGGAECYAIALISPTLGTHKQWVNDFGINGQEYVHVSRVDHVRGRYFSAIQPGLQAWKVDADIVDAARDRVRQKPLPQITDWDKLREKYFEECCEIKPTCYVPPPMDVPASMKQVVMAPHDLFEWFKKNLPNTQISEGRIEEIARLVANESCSGNPSADYDAAKAAITQLMKGGEVKQNKGYHYDGDTSSTPTTNESKQENHD